MPAGEQHPRAAELLVLPREKKAKMERPLLLTASRKTLSGGLCATAAGALCYVFHFERLTWVLLTVLIPLVQKHAGFPCTAGMAPLTLTDMQASLLNILH